MLKKPAWLFAFGLAAALMGCRQSGVQRCLDLVEAKQHAAAAKRCEEVYVAEGDPRAGAAVVKAFYNLEQGDKVLAWKERLAKDGKLTAGVRSYAATIHQQRGEIEAAENEFRRDLALSRAEGNHQRSADILYRLYYFSRGRSGYHEKFLLASEAYKEAVQARDRDLQARAAQALYAALFELGDLEGAHKALEIASELVEKNDRAGQAHLLNNWGTVLTAEGKLALARHDFEQALEMGSGESEEFFRGVHLNLTDVLLQLGDLSRAAHHLEEAWKHAEPAQAKPSSMLYYRARVASARGRLAEATQSLETALSQNPDLDWAWQLWYQQGLLEEARGNLRAAESSYKQSVAIVEELRRSLPFDEFKAWLLDEKRQPFEALFRLQAHAGRAREALATAERAQARTFLDAFLHASSTIGAVEGKPWSTGASLQRIRGLESLLPAMSESPVATLQPIDQILNSFGDRHGLVYFEAGDEFWLITIAEGQVQLRELTASADEIRRMGSRFLANPDDSQLATRLGAILLPPESLPKRGHLVHVVADGILANVPFAALRRDTRYLVENRSLVFVPSLSALAALESHRKGTIRPPLVLTDPLGNLPGAAAEGIAVAKLVNGTVLTSKNATSGELRKASQASTLHLAMHGGLGPRGPWLQLADRRVSSSDIIAERIHPQLVVLASCASGVRPGRQMWGSLGTAFLAAGSRSVLASLWSIDDRHARDFVLDFYSEGGVSDPSGALARAQRVAISRGQSPTLWAPFVLFGSGSTLNETQ
ncbi:MAG TPA: CHAT domain-containing protein [Thermoanaerobaculia bacterium]|nr:CHAT domain-containing protein [Thermoanaerobaculia bacterium]